MGLQFWLRFRLRFLVVFAVARPEVPGAVTPDCSGFRPEILEGSFRRGRVWEDKDMEQEKAVPLARLARETTAENPWPLGVLAEKMKGYIDRMDPTWVCAQVIEFNQRPGNKMSFFIVKDLSADVSMPVKAFGGVVAAAGPQLQAGAQVVLQVKPDFYTKTGSLALLASRIVPVVGRGGLLEQLEELRQKLAAQGLFAAEHKKPLPFLPRRIGLICGHGARAKADVIENATRRWPLAVFEVREVAVQGVNCAAEVSAAIAELDALPEVDVLVVTRGGGALEDLLGFSDESVVRAAFAARTPLVSAVGHEEDAPLLDFVADFRASTPTDAAKRIVPDLAAELELMDRGRQKMRAVVERRVTLGLQELAQWRSRPVLLNPGASFQARRIDVARGVDDLRARLAAVLARESQQLAGTRATLRAISPQAVLDRGYAVLRAPGGVVLTDAAQVKKGDLLEAVLARGSLVATVFGTNTGKASTTNKASTTVTE